MVTLIVRIARRDVGFAAAVLAAATLIRWALDPYLGNSIPYVTYFAAIMVVAWRASTPVAIASTVAAWLLAVFFFIPPRFAISFGGDPAVIVGSLAYFLAAGFMVFFGYRTRVARNLVLHNERQLELVSNAVPALISYIDADRRYVSCNDEYTRWFGLTRDQIVGRTVREVLGEDAWRVVGPQLDEAFAGRLVKYEAESRYQRGGTRWIHVTYTPHRHDDGRVLGLVAMVTDISERKRAELHAALLANVGELFATDAPVEESARAVARSLVAQLGLSRCLLAEAEDHGDTLKVIHHESAEPEASQVGTYRIGDFLTADERLKLANGVPLVINDVREGRDTAAAARFRALGIGAVVSAPYISDGRRKFTLAAEKREPYEWKADEVELLREVSSRMYLQLDRARAEQTLRDSERRYRSLASVITDIPCTVNADGRFITRQHAWSLYTGQGWHEYRDCGWLDAVHPDDREPSRQKFLEACRTRSLFEARARIWHAETREFRHIIARATPMFDDHGVLREWVGACTDVHDDMTATEALIAADRRKDEFLATLAHELRNPLAPIRNSLHILKLTGHAEGAVANVHQMLDRQVKHLVRLVDDLMEVSRITRGRIELRKERIDLEPVLQSAIETSRPLIDEAGHRLEVSLPPQRLWLEADAVRLAQVVANLLNNAAKYTDHGGHIRLSARGEGESVVISVRDNGRGISAALLPKIFELFTNAGEGFDRPGSGLGIGLTIVRRLVELHGGTVEARSDGRGHGSEFIVRLPLDASGACEGLGRLPSALPVSSRRILVVDDNRDAAESLGVLLTLLGIETRTAHDGVAALRALDEFRPSVMLLDLGMPGMDGIELARRTRQHPLGQHVTLIALTGWGQERDRRSSQEAGIDHHLVKPVDLDTLRQLLASLPQSPGRPVRSA